MTLLCGNIFVIFDLMVFFLRKYNVCIYITILLFEILVN